MAALFRSSRPHQLIINLFIIDHYAIDDGASELHSFRLMIQVCSHLQTGDSEATGIIGQCSNGDNERRVRDVLIIKFNRNLVVP